LFGKLPYLSYAFTRNIFLEVDPFNGFSGIDCLNEWPAAYYYIFLICHHNKITNKKPLQKIAEVSPFKGQIILNEKLF